MCVLCMFWWNIITKEEQSRHGDLLFRENKWPESSRYISPVHCPKETLSSILVERLLRGYGIQVDLCLFVPCYFLTIPYTMTICNTKYHHQCQPPCHTIHTTS